MEVYKGVTLMPTLYKVNTFGISGKDKEGIRGKRDNTAQSDRVYKGNGYDGQYVLNYMINKQLGKKGRRMIALFIDLKATFDTVDRGFV